MLLNDGRFFEGKKKMERTSECTKCRITRHAIV